MMKRILSLAAVGIFLTAAACSSEPATNADSSADAFSSSTSGASQMSAIVVTARAAAAGLTPGGRCYAAVARYIDTVGYGNMAKQPASAIGSLPSIPDAYGTYAHQFADYANDHLGTLGLTKLGIDSPYDAPAGAIVVVRAGTPGTSNPTAGDISIAAGHGVFYNDGDMSYGGASSFPSGNDFVLGIYVPASLGPACTSDEDCNGGNSGTGKVCGASAKHCISGCHDDDDCPSGTTCTDYACQ